MLKRMMCPVGQSIAWAIILLFIISFPSIPRANTYDLGMRDGMPFSGILLYAPMAFQAQTLIHEGSHAVAGLGMGYGVDKFVPYPHYDEKFRFGYISTEEEIVSERDEIIFLSAPSIMDFVMFATADILLEKVIEPRSTWGRLLYLFGIVAPYVDFSFNFMFGSDWNRIRKISGDKVWIPMVIGTTALGVGLYRLVYRTRKAM